MLLAQYHLSPMGEIVSNEIPRLAEDESVRMVRTQYHGEASILVEVIGARGEVAEQIMFAGLTAGTVTLSLEAAA